MEKVNGNNFEVFYLEMGDKSYSWNTWIIDFGATHHMTFDSKYILKYTSSSSSVIPCIIFAYGSHTLAVFLWRY